jgi:hypothetical protein
LIIKEIKIIENGENPYSSQYFLYNKFQNNLLLSIELAGCFHYSFEKWPPSLRFIKEIFEKTNESFAFSVVITFGIGHVMIPMNHHFGREFCQAIPCQCREKITFV